MNKDKNGRISLTLKEADEIREFLETLFSMEGTLDEDFNAECKKAGKHARKLFRLIHGEGSPGWQMTESGAGRPLYYVE